MGGEGPYVRFESSYRSTSWANHSGLIDLGDEELEAAYIRARVFMREKKRELVDDYGWIPQPEEDAVRHTHLWMSQTVMTNEQYNIGFIRPCWNSQLVRTT